MCSRWLVALGLGITLLTGCIDADAPIEPGNDADFVFEVPKGTTANGLGGEMTALGLVDSEFQWKMLLNDVDASCLKAGRFTLRRSMSLREVIDTLCGTPMPDDVPFTVVEGWRIVDIDEALAAKGWIAPGAYAQIATKKTVDAPFEVPSPNLEGYLFPETYMVPADRFDPKGFIERQLQTFKTRFLDRRFKEVEDRGLHAVVVMASMIEREEPTPSQRPIVAGILWKRLDNGWQLGVDATSHYTLEEWNDRKGLLRNLRDKSDPYNTRIHHGLPPTAIGNPSVSSLDAALKPQGSPYWFYLHDKNGVFHGGRDGDEHDRNRRKYNVY